MTTHTAVLAHLMEDAADRIDRYGLHKDDWFDMDGWHAGTIKPRATAVCAEAAISLAGGWRPSLTNRYEVPESADATLALVYFADWLTTQGLAARKCLHLPAFCRDPLCRDATDTVRCWSDDPARTRHQVVAALRGCAASLHPADGTPKEAAR